MRSRLLALFLSLIRIAKSAAGDESGRIPEWVWGTADRSPAGQSVVLSDTFDLYEPTSRAWLQLAADFCRCQMVLNGRHVATVDDFGPRLELDLTDGLRIGQNRIELTALSSAGPSGIACSLEVTSSEGGETVIRSSSDWTADVASATEEHQRGSAISFGQVLPQMWTRSARVTSFDDYTQWKQAIDAEEGTSPAKFSTHPGFEIRLLRSAANDEGSWISMAFDPQGRLTVAREDRGLLRMTLADDSSAVAEVETINDSLVECRGLLYAYDSLYANANNSKGLYRLRDTTGDDQFDDVTLLREFPGNVGHGRNDLALGPDGMIYSIHGDAVHIPTDRILDHTSPFREARRGRPTTEGHLIRTDRDGHEWELIAAGLRNPFGIDFDAEGQAFTYDADAEHDMGAPWYRPTRLVHLFSGADFGWRGRTGDWPPYDPDHAENALPVANIGKGSPTAVAFGYSGNFPEPYHSALFVLDWAYGRVLACHLQPRGAGFVCRTEAFLKGRPLNVTDLAFGPDGALYVITGGRKTQSALYRVAHVGNTIDPLQPNRQQLARNDFSRRQRMVLSQLTRFHGRVDPSAVEAVWMYLGSLDPTLRHAAQTVLEHQPLDQWQHRALVEEDPAIAVVALSSVARSGEPGVSEAVARRLNQLPFAPLTAYQQSSLLNAYDTCLSRGAIEDDLRAEIRSRLESLFPVPHESIAPIGAGHGINRQLATLLLLRLESNSVVARTVALLRHAETQEDRLHYLFTLRHSRSGWSLADRTTYFKELGELERTAFSGAGMPSFLSQIREEALATLSDLEADSLGGLVESGATSEPAPLTIDRTLVREWTTATLFDELSRETHKPDVAAGRTVFDEAMCGRCHRINGRGGVLGPDLTSVGSRFGRRDLLKAIMAPSSVIADKYRNTQVVTSEGQVFTGRITTAGDYRSPRLRIATDPLRPWEHVEIAKTEIDTYLPSPVSPMPEGLLNTFTAAEILDLLVFLEAAAVQDLPVRESPD